MFIRVNKDKQNPYVMAHKGWINDQRMSWKAKGIMIYLLSLPDNWKIYQSELENHAKDGVKSTTSGVHELIELGYISRVQYRDEQGKFAGYDYTIYESVPEMPFWENR